MKRYRYAICFMGVVSIFLQGAAAQGRIAASEGLRSESSLRSASYTGSFPLEIGNEWIYSDGTQTFKVQVLRETEESNYIQYFELSGYFQEDPAKVRKIRRGSLDQILEFNPGGEDFLWYDFGTRESTWNLQTGSNIPCITGSLVSRAASGETVEGPAGTFENTARLDLVPRCMDAGITNEYFAGGIGLVQRVVTTFAGSRTFKLVSARVGSQQLPATPYGVEVSMDRPAYFNNLMPPIVNPWPTAKVALVVRNNTDTPVEFIFPTSQRFDFVVQDALGKEVLRWSDGLAFAQVVGQEKLLNESRRYSAEVVLKSREGKALPAGFYTLTGYLTLQRWEPGIQDMSGTIGFEIRDLH